jgi:hypothetical protein
LFWITLGQKLVCDGNDDHDQRARILNRKHGRREKLNNALFEPWLAAAGQINKSHMACVGMARRMGWRRAEICLNQNRGVQPNGKREAVQEFRLISDQSASSLSTLATRT